VLLYTFRTIIQGRGSEMGNGMPPFDQSSGQFYYAGAMDNMRLQPVDQMVPYLFHCR
jgi:hypothetical protein